MAASTLYDDLVAELDRQIEREYNPWEPDNQSAASKRMTALRQRVMTEDPLTDAYTEGRKDEADENGAASRLIDAWAAAYGKPVPWAKAVEIVAITNKLPDAERARLLALADEAVTFVGMSDDDEPMAVYRGVSL